jgi:hypothetical protein
MHESATLWLPISPFCLSNRNTKISFDLEPVSGFEPLTVRLQEALLPLAPSWTANRASPSCLHIGWSGLTNPF